jgi:hypothetical protein
MGIDLVAPIFQPIESLLSFKYAYTGTDFEADIFSVFTSHLGLSAAKLRWNLQYQLSRLDHLYRAMSPKCLSYKTEDRSSLIIIVQTFFTT